MTQVTTITKPETTRRKAALDRRLKELLGTSAGREDLQIEYLADPLDQMKSNLDREMAIQRLNNQARLVRDIQLALAAIEDGTYGLCERCEESIPRKRLDAVPWARRCVPCQSEIEDVKRDGNLTFADAA